MGAGVESIFSGPPASSAPRAAIEARRTVAHHRPGRSAGIRTTPTHLNIDSRSFGIAARHPLVALTAVGLARHDVHLGHALLLRHVELEAPVAAHRHLFTVDLEQRSDRDAAADV